MRFEAASGLVSDLAPPFCGFRPKLFVSLAEDVCISLSLLYRMKVKHSVRVCLTTIEVHRAVSAAVQAWTTGEVVRMGSRDKAWRAVSIGAMSISWDHPPFANHNSRSGVRVKVWFLEKDGISSVNLYSLHGRWYHARSSR
jgi:hypothetical protein